MNSPRVLIVEDDEVCAKCLSLALSHECEVDHVESVQRAITLLQEKLYQLVLLDLGLPNSKGFETWQKVKPHKRTSAVVIVTGDPSLRRPCLESGADGFLEKGISDFIDQLRSVSIGAMTNKMQSLQDYTETVDQIIDESIMGEK